MRTNKRAQGNGLLCQAALVSNTSLKLLRGALKRNVVAALAGVTHVLQSVQGSLLELVFRHINFLNRRGAG